MYFARTLRIFKGVVFLVAIEALIFQLLLYNKVIYTNNSEKDSSILDKIVNILFLFLTLYELYTHVLMLWCGLKLVLASNLDKAKRLSVPSVFTDGNHNVNLRNGSANHKSLDQTPSLLTYEGVYFYTKKHYPWIRIKSSDENESISLVKSIFSYPIILIILFILFFINLSTQVLFVGLSFWSTTPIFSYSFFPALVSVAVISGTLKGFIPGVMLDIHQKAHNKKEVSQQES